jgi:hypothetical protein
MGVTPAIQFELTVESAKWEIKSFHKDFTYP